VQGYKKSIATLVIEGKCKKSSPSKMQVEQVFNALLDSVQAEQNQRAKAEKTLLQVMIN
jgi:hypothetical protein